VQGCRREHHQPEQITDAGLIYLKKLTSLENVNLAGPCVTDAGVEDLKQYLPRLRDTHRPRPPESE
jgi:hypothetical protein